jgi:prevent-host-death family protein
MRSATITEVKNQLSAIIDRVRAGESVVVTDRGQPVARFEPVRTDVDDAARLVRLERSGIIRPASKPPRPLQAPLPVSTASAVDALIDERRSGR